MEPALAVAAPAEVEPALVVAAPAEVKPTVAVSEPAEVNPCCSKDLVEPTIFEKRNKLNENKIKNAAKMIKKHDAKKTKNP